MSRRSSTPVNVTLACDCGGRLVVPVEQAAAIDFPLRPAKASEQELARRRMLRPHEWATFLVRICSSCGRAYFVATCPGKLWTLEGEILEVGNGDARAAPESFRHPGPLGEPDRAYGEARLAILRARLRPPQVIDRLEDLADRFPERADALTREAADLHARGNRWLPELPSLLTVGALTPENAQDEFSGQTHAGIRTDQETINGGPVP